MATAVNDKSAAALALTRDWAMLEALMGGTSAMRDAAQSLLPRWPAEDDDGYKARLASATLFPAYRRTVSVMVGKPFGVELTASDDMPAELVEWFDDIDREGVSLHVFAAEMFEETFYGLAGILIDAPRPVPTQGAVATMRDQKAAGVRPYFVRVKHEQILGWRTAVGANGARYLAQLRIMECVTENAGDFGESVIEQVRVLEPGRWAVHRRNTKGLWDEIERGETPLPFIPFVPLYGRRRGFMDGAPPLAELAHLNVEHWQSKSDQQTILHAARVPILFGSGFEAATEIEVSPWRAVITTNPDAKLAWVEHSGQAIEAGAASLEALEQQMIQSGAELLVKKPGTRTATETANDAEGNKSDLRRMIENFEDSLNQAVAIMGTWAKLATVGTLTVFKDFGAASLSGASSTLIKELAAAGIISNKTAIVELKRRGELSPEVDADDEAEAIADQGPLLADIRADPLKIVAAPPVPPTT